MTNLRHRPAVAEARMKIVKPDILSLVTIGHPSFSDDDGESSCGLLRLLGAARVR